MTEFSSFGKPHESQRGYFSAQLYEEMIKNKDIFLLIGDLGFGMFDKHREQFKDRVINTGAAEQAMVAIAVGLALEGKVPFCYSITPFLLYRPFEVIRNYVNEEEIPVKLVGSGRDRDYAHDGFSHWAEEDREIMKIFTNIIPFWPENKEEVPNLVTKVVNNGKPTYLNLKR
jgi:transketolase